jgi:hypothetical protein
MNIASFLKWESVIQIRVNVYADWLRNISFRKQGRKLLGFK